MLFEQSGTFKNEFKKLGYEALDYDILNDFGETDCVVDLYREIGNAYRDRPSIFDAMSKDDLIMAFFPCIRFENQIILSFTGNARQQKTWSDEQKLEYDLKLHKELHNNYKIVTKLAIVCLRRNIKLIIENPYSSQHYLTRYWGLKPKIVDTNRREMGDIYEKPTQYWFINCEPLNNVVLDEAIEHHPKMTISKTNSTVGRSMITKGYARRFIRSYVVPYENQLEEKQ